MMVDVRGAGSRERGWFTPCCPLPAPRPLRRPEDILACFAQERPERGWRIEVVAIQVNRDSSLHRYAHIRNAYL
jgi:hypothetical protein